MINSIVIRSYPICAVLEHQLSVIVISNISQQLSPFYMFTVFDMYCSQMGII